MKRGGNWSEMGDVGCYYLQLYCDHPNHKFYKQDFCEDFTGPTLGYCLRHARKQGWLISRTKQNKDRQKYCLCPIHSGKAREL